MMNIFYRGIWNFDTCYAGDTLWDQLLIKTSATESLLGFLVDYTSHTLSQFVAKGSSASCMTPWGEVSWKFAKIFLQALYHVPFSLCWLCFVSFAVMNMTLCWVLWVSLANHWSWDGLKMHPRSSYTSTYNIFLHDGNNIYAVLNLFYIVCFRHFSYWHP